MATDTTDGARQTRVAHDGLADGHATTETPAPAGRGGIPVDIQAALYKQEHRLVPVMFNFLSSRHLPKGDPRRSGALFALVYYFFSPSAAAKGGIGLAGILGLYLAWQANSLLSAQNEFIKKQTEHQKIQNEKIDLQIELVKSQNASIAEQTRHLGTQNEKTDLQIELLKSQNRSIESQTLLMEAARVSNLLAAQLPPLLDAASKPDIDKDSVARRLAALSQTLTPYSVHDEHAGGRKTLSPERAQMFIAVWKTGFPLAPIGKFGGTFAFADLRRAQLEKLECEGLSFDDADFSQANLSDAKFKRCTFMRTKFKGVEFPGSSYSSCDFGIPDGDLRVLNAAFDECKFNKDVVALTDFPFQDYSGCHFVRCEFFGSSMTRFRQFKSDHDFQHCYFHVDEVRVIFTDTPFYEMPSPPAGVPSNPGTVIPSSAGGQP
jgi:Pentapeptide repeats (8 copies)